MVRIHFSRNYWARAFQFMRVFATGAVVLSVGLSAHGADRRRPQTAAETVSIFYALTEGARSRCRHASAETAATYEQALARFAERHTALISRVRHSPHYEQARRQFAREAAYDPSRDTAQSLDPECRVQAGILQMMTETDAGLNAVRRYETILSE
jgi:hypothetical protein